MNFSIRTKLIALCIILVLITISGISATYYVMTKQDKQRESQERIQIAFDIILNDFTERVNTYTESVNKFLQENIALLWATYTYGFDDSEQGTIRFLFDHFSEVSEELKQFGRVALADRVMLYGANKRLLVVYQRLENHERKGAYLVSEDEGPHYLPMDDPSIQAELTFRHLNAGLRVKNKPLPDVPLPPGVQANYTDDIPNSIMVELFREGQQLGIRIVAPIYRRHAKMGFLVGEVFYTQSMIDEYASLSKTEINFFSGNILSIGTQRLQTSLGADVIEQAALCQDLQGREQPLDIFPIQLKDSSYYQGRCQFKHEQDIIGAITVNLSQDIEKREIGKILQAVFMISGVSIIVCIGLVSWVMVPKFTGPIIKLTNAALRMAQGDLQQTIDTSGRDELGTLARSFTYMRNQVQQTIEELQQLNAELDRRVEERTAELARQKYILDTFMATVPDRIYFRDIQGRITRANMAHAKRLGLQNPSEEVGKTVFHFFPEDIARRKHQQEQDIIQSGIPRIGVEEKQEWPDGREEWSLTTKMPLHNEHGDIIGIFGISRDITELKHTEETMKLAKEAAEAANRAKSEFLANMNHELRTPLNVILGLAQVMNRNPNIPEAERENLHIIYRSGEHLLILINTVLDLSKIEASHMTLQENNIDIHHLLNELEEMFSLKAAQKHLRLSFKRDTQVPHYIRTDATKLRQILMNLLNNAVKFTKEGNVSLDCRLAIDDGRLNDETHPDQQAKTIDLQFSISDTGAGIAPEEMGLVFEAFGQTQSGRDAQEGTGLGLTITQKFVKLLGGNIAVNSHVGQGTTFTVVIPIEPTDSIDNRQSTTSNRVLALEPGQPSYRILIVDDKHNNRSLLIKLFSPLGFDIREATNGQEAVSVWNAFKPHIIWMDLRMPVMDGYEATKAIRNEEINIKSLASKAPHTTHPTIIIAITTGGEERIREAAISAGCNDFLRKPFREAEIFDIMRTYLGVRYIYEQPDTTQEHLAIPEIGKWVNADTLSTLPPDLCEALKQAVDVTSPEMMERVIEQISKHHSRLADALAELTKHYRFDILQSMFEEHPYED